MLLFPRYFDMFEMKRPQFMGGFGDEDTFEPYMNNQPAQQHKQARRIPVPVHHEPTFQEKRQYQRQFQQMPVPQPTGVTYPHQQQNTALPSSDESPQPVRNPIKIPVRHVPSAQQSGVPIAPPDYSQTERWVPIKVEQASREVPKEMEIEQECHQETDQSDTHEPLHMKETQKRPAVRKQTSLVVSDDHTTPIAMPYEHLETGETIMEEGEAEEKNDLASSMNVKAPAVRKQTSLIVSDDHTTPIPMPYEQLMTSESQIIEEDAEGQADEEGGCGKSAQEHEPEQYCSGECKNGDVKVQNNEVKDNNENTGQEDLEASGSEQEAESESEKKADASVSRFRTVPIKVTVAPKNSDKWNFPPKAREIPITVHGPVRPAQRASQQQKQPEMPQRSEQMINTNGRLQMPQPNPTGNEPTTEAAQPTASFTPSGDTYTQPRPPAPKPKEKWVDPRISAALETVKKISDEAESVGAQVDGLQVTSKDRTYLTIEEQLTKLLLKLDSIDSLGDDDVRSKRKACIRQVQQTLDALELKLEAS